MMNTALQSTSSSEALVAPGLLVSVRSLEEFRRVVDQPVDVLDFKEPQRGALAAADPQLWQQAAAEAPPTCRLSAALGEWDSATELAAQVPPPFAYAKAGPAGATSTAQLATVWAELRRRLPPNVELVAVAYADHQRAQCPQPEAILQAAADAGLRTWLVDTFDKTAGRDSLNWLGFERLRDIQRMAERTRSRWVLAGSISRQTAIDVVGQGVRPHLFGVRGDVCDGSRTGQLVPAKVGRWLEWLGGCAAGVNDDEDRQRAQAEA